MLELFMATLWWKSLRPAWPGDVRFARPLAGLPSGPCLLTVATCLLAPVTLAQTNQAPAALERTVVTNTPAGDAVLIELTGVAEILRAGTDVWVKVTRGQPLQLGDRLRTGEASRAAIQLTDHSLIRLEHSSSVRLMRSVQIGVLERIRLEIGRLFFFNREKPATMEIETPLVTGAIRGTEFVLSVSAVGTTRLLMLDGLVDLTSNGEKLALGNGDEVEIQAGQPPRISHGVLATNQIQWALYYPAVVEADDLVLSADEQTALAPALAAYRRGNVGAALAAKPSTAPGDGGRTLLAALLLAVGEVAEAEALLNGIPETGATRALRELIRTVTGAPGPANPTTPASASEWLARSFQLQAASKLSAALEAAQAARRLAPGSGFAAARVAELAFSEERPATARNALEDARRLSPENPRVDTVDGFFFLDVNRYATALQAFDRALALDAGYGDAWLGRGLALQGLSRHAEALAAFEAASALEPRRSIFRSYAAKSASQLGDRERTRKELRLAKALDPRDPTPWLYSALDRHQNGEFNDGIRDLEKSVALNDNRSVLRSEMQLDRDRAVRSADLASLYDAVGMSDVSERAAGRAVDTDYSNFAGHLFLARSLQSQEDPARYNLRFEAARQSELLLSNLLAPAGGGNLSQQLSQQDHLRFFNAPSVAFSSQSLWTGNGDWNEAATLFGTIGGLGYAIDAQYLSLNGWRPNQETERFDLEIIAKQQVTAEDSLYLQVGGSRQTAGDTALYWDPASANPGLHVEQKQLPFVHVGWNHQWAPGSNTLLLGSYYSDELNLTDPTRPVPFLRQRNGVINIVDTGRAVYQLDQHSEFNLGSIELQQLWQSGKHTVIVGGRYQRGEVDASATLSGLLPPPIFDRTEQVTVERISGYGYYKVQPADWLRLDLGGSYESLLAPRNVDLPPFTSRTARQELVSPKVGLTLQPWERTTLQAAWSRSLGGLYYDNSLRLEPTRIAGFNQAFRSLASESVAGIVPGTEFEMVGVQADHATLSGLYLGVSAQRLRSSGDREVGAVSNSLPFPLPDTVTSTREILEFEERSVGAYAHQLLGRFWAVGARYQVARAELTTQYPDIPRHALGLNQLEADQQATLHAVQLFAVINHDTGWFARWESDWFRQHSTGYNNGPGDEDIWLHGISGGYRFPGHRAEVRVGVANLFNTDNRLNPLNLQAEWSRQRTAFVTVRLNF